MSNSITQATQLSLASAALLNGGVLPSPVIQSSNSNAALVDAASSIAEDASVVVTLGGGGDEGTTYDAAGLLNSFTQAGSLQGSVASDPATAAAAVDDQLLGGTAASSGTLAGLSSNWGSLLQNDPALSNTAVQDSTDSSIVDTLA
ncbi:MULTISPECIES: hypothetical protein [Aquitalea]|uniref:Uncharacterized protein n=1 Tax=Aquitalea magnusonii TaxID=332411 RepID=A0A318J9C7_9NEIS|nr:MULTISPECIES: hypothetical protein [Aquitalea]PXX44342.1 hypothetical protein DFR38_11324 [Aquitalea magnusonii]